MMVKKTNYAPLVRHLEKLNSYESFLKEYFEAQGDQEKINQFLIEHGNDKKIRRIKNPELVFSRMAEEDWFLREHRNVALVKHTRYIPFFLHQHKYFECTCVISGSCKEHFKDQVLTLREGDLCLLAPSVPHSLEVYGGCLVLYIMIRYSTFLNIFTNMVRDKSRISAFFLGGIYKKNNIKYMIYHTAGDRRVRNSILDMYMEHHRDDEFTDHIISSMLELFFVYLTRTYNESVEMPERPGKPTPYDDKIISHIMLNYSTVSLESLSKAVCLSPSHCSRLIRSITGHSFTELLHNIRMRRGKEMLLNTSLSAAFISEQLGYENTETFIRAYKRFYKTTPGQFRKNNMNA
jgi:AraC-like DNA-binding protein/mannose-6-phosphate isomerase-like protein (cupin superfamily)